MGTRNPGKLGEYRLLLAGSGFELATPQELGLEADEAEGTTSLEEMEYTTMPQVMKKVTGRFVKV